MLNINSVAILAQARASSALPVVARLLADGCVAAVCGACKFEEEFANSTRTSSRLLPAAGGYRFFLISLVWWCFWIVIFEPACRTNIRQRRLLGAVNEPWYEGTSGPVSQVLRIC